jgi:hypothetical protein
LQSLAGIGTLKDVQRWHYIALAGVAVLGLGYGAMQLRGPHAPAADDTRDANGLTPPTARPAVISWEKLDRSGDGFRVEMPTEVKQIQIPAYNNSGGSDPVNMIFSNPDAETEFSVSWEDNPPVARAVQAVPESILDAARDGALARTQTALAGESTVSVQGFPGKDFSATNAGGGVMNSRLIYAGSRLYMLNAAFPSASARRDRDVRRFFNSFILVSSSGASSAGAKSAS